jgi:hypothetical protein
MPRTHIGGEHAGRFWELVGPVAPERVLLLGVDVSKPSWFALGSDLGGNVVLEGVKLMADAVGLEQLLELLEATRRRLNAELVVVDDAGRASVQAGAGIVADSVPAHEDLECRNKARALLAAVPAARRMTAARRSG